MAMKARPTDAAQAEHAPTEPNWWKRTMSWWNWRRAAIAVFLFAVAVAVGLITVGSIWASGDVPLEAAKAGLQLLAVAIFGGAVAAAFRWLEAYRDEQRRTEAASRVEQRRCEAASREEERRLDDYRAARVAELWDAYNRIKTVRRALRAAGFAAPSGKLTDEQIAVFRTRMVELNDAQLSLEKLVKLINGQKDVFGREYASITDGSCERNITSATSSRPGRIAKRSGWVPISPRSAGSRPTRSSAICGLSSTEQAPLMGSRAK
jgi:hypothetical protein